jgi:hypothetical protein
MTRAIVLVLVSTLAFSASAARRHAVQFPSNPQPVVPQTVVLAPSRDATLYLTGDGSLASGTGAHIIVGATNGFQLRRALLAFDIASQIPPGSHVTKVSLTLRLSRTISGSQSIELHRVTADWGEGPSNAGTSREGIGAAAKGGDATWIHTFFPDKRWAKAGGDFTPAPDAAADAGGIGDVTWVSSAAMIARVQSWVDQPATNFGWILIGNETTPTTTKQFDSREIVPDSTRPALNVEFTK